MDLFCCVVGGERLQSFGPQHRHFVVVLAFEDGNRRIRIGRGINARIQNLREIFGLFAGLMLAKKHERGQHKQRERGCAAPNQTRHRPPCRSCPTTAGSVFAFAGDSLMNLVAEKFLVTHRLGSQLLLQERAESLRAAFFGAGHFQIRKRLLKGEQFFAAQLIIEPGGPFFFKRFHTRPSGYFVTSYGHKTIATSPYRWSNPTSRRFRDTAFLQSLSSKLLRDVPAKVARWLCRSDREPRDAPFAGGEADLLLARSWTP